MAPRRPSATRSLAAPPSQRLDALLLRLALIACVALAVLAGPAAGQKILVFDDSPHGMATAAAKAISPTGVTVASTASFVNELNGSSWDAVVISNRSSTPSGGWPAVVSHIAAGGKVILSFWDWDNNSGYGDPALYPAFEISNLTELHLSTQTLQDSGTTGLFNGVTMPLSSWHSHSADDGDEFTPTGGAIGIAHVGNPSKPVMVLGNSGRTIASFLLSEAGDVWFNDGSALNLWTNLINQILTGGCTQIPAQAITRVGTPPNPDVFFAVGGLGPVVGADFVVQVDHTSFMPDAILDIVVVSALGTNTVLPSGTLLVELSFQYYMGLANAGDPFVLPVPFDCAFVGLGSSLQVASLKVDDMQLTNALDVLIGTS